MTFDPNVPAYDIKIFRSNFAHIIFIGNLTHGNFLGRIKILRGKKSALRERYVIKERVGEERERNEAKMTGRLGLPKSML